MPRKLSETAGVILIWAAANLLGAAIVGGIILLFSLLTLRTGMLVSTLVAGLPIGIVQWITLKRIAPVSFLWVFTIFAGLILGLMMGPVLAEILGAFLDGGSGFSMTAAFTTIALLVGLAQWVFLRDHFERAWVWPLGSVLGLGLGTALVSATNLIHQSEIIAITLAVLVYGMTTGFVLSRLSAADRKTA